MLNAIKPSKKTVILYLLVPVVLFIFTVFVPLVTALVYSFFEWKGGPKKTFIGIANYKQLFQDGVFWQAFGHNIYLVIACIIGQIGIAFVLVLMINSKLVKCKGVHRTFGFFPSTISAVCIGLIWNMIYHNKYGILNWFLKAIGRPDLCQVWLNNSKLVMLLVTIPLIWLSHPSVRMSWRVRRSTAPTAYRKHSILHCHLSKIRFLSALPSVLQVT